MTPVVLRASQPGAGAEQGHFFIKKQNLNQENKVIKFLLGAAGPAKAAGKRAFLTNRKQLLSRTRGRAGVPTAWATDGPAGLEPALGKPDMSQEDRAPSPQPTPCGGSVTRGVLPQSVCVEWSSFGGEERVRRGCGVQGRSEALPPQHLPDSGSRKALVREKGSAG